MKKYIYLVLILFINSIDKALSQTALTDSAQATTAAINTINIYYSQIGENAHLFNGAENNGYNQSVLGHPYLDSTVMEEGDIFFDGVLYKKIPLLYDLYNDQIIINKYKQNYKITLPKEKIGFFSLNAHTYIRMNASTKEKDLIAGFYDRVYDGNTTVLVKRKKLLADADALNGVARMRYTPKENYFVKTKGDYTEITNKKNLFKLFGEQYKDVRKYLKKNKINYKKQPEYYIAKASEYFDQLTH
jgi:hypothetical protein